MCGAPRAENFQCEPCDEVQEEQLKDGQVLLKTCYLSVDPAQVSTGIGVLVCKAILF